MTEIEENAIRSRFRCNIQQWTAWKEEWEKVTRTVREGADRSGTDLSRIALTGEDTEHNRRQKGEKNDYRN